MPVIFASALPVLHLKISGSKLNHSRMALVPR
jgi:hypothetical protein